MMITQYNTTLVPALKSPGIKRSASPIKHQSNDDKLTTGDQIKVRNGT